MPRQPKGYRQKMRPYLASDEVLQLTGASRRLLNTVVEYGICSPFRDEECSGTLCWTPGQVELLDQVITLRNAGLSFESIASLAAGGHDALAGAVKTAHAQTSRCARRETKRLAHAEYLAGEALKIGPREGHYVRYIPQRWMALIPLAADMDAAQASFAQAILLLSSIAEHAGWAATRENGIIASAPDPSELGIFGFITLATQPQPAPFGSATADCGCYHSFGAPCTIFDEAACDSCTFSGSPIDNHEQLAWNTFLSAEDTKNPTVMFDTLERPYATGPWSKLTELAASQGPMCKALFEAHADELSARERIAVRPRLMPHITKLPLGVTACVLPAGMYLCRQADTRHRPSVISEMMGLSRAIPHREMSVTKERELSAHAEKVVELLKMSRGDSTTSHSMLEPLEIIGDPAQIGWSHDIDDADISQLIIPTATGLTPRTDFLLTCATMPAIEYDELPRYETQILIDPSKIFGGEPKGAVRRIVPMLKSIRPDRTVPVTSVRCRICGAFIPTRPDVSIATCERCGRVQPQPRINDSFKMDLLRECEELRARGKYHAALRSAEHACRVCPDDPETHWSAFLCRYEVHYHAKPKTGLVQAFVENPLDAPVREDPDCQAALRLADDDQWAVYSRQAQAIEEARQNALKEPQPEGEFRVHPDNAE